MTARPNHAEGQLAVDVYQTDTALVIRAPIAGVKLKDITISATEDMIKIKGERMIAESIPEDRYFTQECYWGPFSRTIVLPAPVDVNRVKATYHDGILRIEVPKAQSTVTRTVSIET